MKAPRIVTGILRAGRMLVNDWVKEVAHVGPRRAVGEQIMNLSSCVPLFLCPSVLGKIRSAVGSAQLLMSQKFQQFYWLCQQNLVSCTSANKDTVHCMYHSLNVFFKYDIKSHWNCILFTLSAWQMACSWGAGEEGWAHVLNETSSCVLRGYFLKSCKKVHVVTVHLCAFQK